MGVLKRILCATDRSESAAKLYRHAAGIAAVAHASLGLVHAGANDGDGSTSQRIREEYLTALPYGGDYPQEPAVFVPDGETVDAVLACAREFGADLIVTGSRRRGPISAWLMGSTSRALLEATTTPLLLIPDNQFDIITIGAGRARLHVGSVIAAVDLTEVNPRQLAVASEMAHLARQPLSLMTVLQAGGRGHEEADHQLRDRAHGLEPVRPHAIIVRRGDLTEEIVRCSVAEESGLVVMGLRSPVGRGPRPGTIASAVLSNGRAAVLAVPPEPASPG